jgi:hypothetical protein
MVKSMRNEIYHKLSEYGRGGTGWKKNDGWMTDARLGRWYGVATENGRVTGLILEENNLVGSIPKELGLLENLAVLILRGNNRLKGVVVADIFDRLTNLKHLDLEFTDLAGSGDGKTEQTLSRLVKNQQLDVLYLPSGDRFSHADLLHTRADGSVRIVDNHRKKHASIEGYGGW